MKFSAFLALLASPFNTLAQARSIIDQTLLQAKAVAAVFAAATLDADEILAGGPESLKIKIEAMTNSAVQAAVTARLEQLTAEHKTALTTQAIAKDAELIAHLATAGVKVDKFEKSAVEAGIKARAETIGHELLAARGIKPIPDVVKNPAQIDAKLDTDEKIVAAYMALPHGSPESVAFLKKHEAVIWGVHSGKK